jgi:predicted transcriptional regulator of viral defense system
MTTESAARRVLDMAENHGVVTARDVREAGIHDQVLTRLVHQGALERVARGSYRLPSALVSEHHGLVLATLAVPHGVVCLLSALRFHELGSQLPHRVWMAIDRRSRKPRIDSPPIHFVRFSGIALETGVETHQIEGVEVRVTSVPKTIADLFKYRNKVGLDVALEALKEGWRERRFTLDELHVAARACRVERVMRPYIEAVVA